MHNRTDRKKEESIATAAESAGQIIEYLLTVVVAAVCVVVPLYVKDGYHQIGNAKYEAYRRIMTGGFGVLLVVAAVYGICRIVQRISSGSMGLSRRSRLSSTDQFVLAYLVLTGISVVSGGFYEDALWGASGWNMGLLSQVSFVLLYLFLSRFGRYYKGVLVALCMVAAVVFTIGILHRLMIDPTGFYDGLTNEQKAQFLSTLGQASWNSDSAYFALAGVMLLFFMMCCESSAALCRFTAVLAMFFAAGKIMCPLMRLHPNPDLTPDFVTELMWNSGLTWGLLAISLGLTVVFYIVSKKSSQGRRLLHGTAQGSGRFPETVIRRLRIGAMGAVLGLICLTVLVIFLQAQGMLPAALADKVSAVSYLNWHSEWGNGRGRIWSFSCKMISEESLGHRIFGVGPDCFITETR